MIEQIQSILSWWVNAQGLVAHTSRQAIEEDVYYHKDTGYNIAINELFTLFLRTSCKIFKEPKDLFLNEIRARVRITKRGFCKSIYVSLAIVKERLRRMPCWIMCLNEALISPSESGKFYFIWASTLDCSSNEVLYLTRSLKFCTSFALKEIEIIDGWLQTWFWNLWSEDRRRFGQGLRSSSGLWLPRFSFLQIDQQYCCSEQSYRKSS